jgi:cyclic-di-GMP phosphodiesterase TipF (flagellum assembly factor)
MTFVLFLLYGVIGCGVGYSLFSLVGIELPMAIVSGVVTTIALGQIHLLSRNKDTEQRLDERITATEKTSRDVDERMNVVEAKTEAIETTVKHELTERRDALVTEMKQLEGLIDRLSRSFETKLSETTTTAAVAPQEDAILRDVRDALRDGRVDLHLQPIVSLPQRRVSFYEGFTRLRRPDGSLILPAEFLDAGRRANLMGIIDNFTLFRCVQIVRRLAERDRRVGVFCNVAAASLQDDAFFPMFLDFMTEHRDLCGSVIFEIRADSFEMRNQKMKTNMDQLTALGFRFSIDHSADIGLDLPRLQDAGVRFVKMNGGTLIEQLRDPHGPRPISSVNRRIEGEEVSAVFSRYGMTLIGEKIEDEASVVEILEYDIPYGQGHIFGAPRPIKASLMEETAPPEALVQKLSSFG